MHANATPATSALTQPYACPPASLARRQRLASLLTPLRRVVPRVPFWKLAAHRVPVLWGLYRGLLRSAGHDQIRWRITKIFNEHRHLTSPAETKEHLLRANRLLNTCRRARQGDSHSRALLDRYASLIAVKREKAQMEQILLDYERETQRLRTMPIVTGYIRPTLYNGFLPRLKPQPLHISMMIKRRRVARFKRGEKLAALENWKRMVEEETGFERELTVRTQMDGRTKAFEAIWDGYQDAWEAPVRAAKGILRKSFKLDHARLTGSCPSVLADRLKAARRERVANKTRERQREARGEVTKRSIRRARTGPPTQVLDRMSKERLKMEKIARSSVSEVGYIGETKRRLGWRLKGGDPYKAEDGPPEVSERLDAMVKEVLRRNEAVRGGSRTLAVQTKST